MTHDEFQIKVIESLAELKTDVKSLVGNGQPGRVTMLEQDVKALIRWRWIVTGGILAVSAVISAIIHFLFRY